MVNNLTTLFTINSTVIIVLIRIRNIIKFIFTLRNQVNMKDLLIIYTNILSFIVFAPRIIICRAFLSVRSGIRKARLINCTRFNSRIRDRTYALFYGWLMNAEPESTSIDEINSYKDTIKAQIYI